MFASHALVILAAPAPALAKKGAAKATAARGGVALDLYFDRALIYRDQWI